MKGWRVGTNMNFPSAIEVKYNNLLNNIKEYMLKAHMQGLSFIDITLINQEVTNYLNKKGFCCNEIRYEYDKNNRYGYHGRMKGDGICIMRIGWAGGCLNTHGNFYNIDKPVYFNE